MLGPSTSPPATPEGSDAILTGTQLLQALQPWLIGGPATISGPGRIPRTVGMRDVEQLREVTEHFRLLDNRTGGALAREAIIGQLGAVTRLLNEASYTESVGRALFAAAGDLATVAGWTSHDVGLHTHAQHYLMLALRAAKEAGDRALGAHALNCLARQANHLKRPADALNLVQLALYGVGQAATPTMTAMLHALEARSYAQMGRLREFDRAAGLAADDFAHSSPETDPPWVAFFDAPECDATLGVCHAIAACHQPHHADTAITMIADAAARRPPERARSRAFDHIALGRAYLGAGHLDEAAAATETALGLLCEVASTRVRDRLGELYAETAPYAVEPVIAELRERITAA